MRSRIKVQGDLFKADDNRQIIITVGALKAAFEKEYNTRMPEIFETAKRDAAAQILATCACALNKEFGFGRKRLRRFKRAVEGLFLAMSRGGIAGKEFNTQHCIDYMRDKYGIDVDTKEAKDIDP